MNVNSCEPVAANLSLTEFATTRLTVAANYVSSIAKSKPVAANYVSSRIVAANCMNSLLLSLTKFATTVAANCVSSTTNSDSVAHIVRDYKTPRGGEYPVAHIVRDYKSSTTSFQTTSLIMSQLNHFSFL